MSAYLEPLLQSGHFGFHPKLPFCGFPTALTLAPARAALRQRDLFWGTVPLQPQSLASAANCFAAIRAPSATTTLGRSTSSLRKWLPDASEAVTIEPTSPAMYRLPGGAKHARPCRSDEGARQILHLVIPRDADLGMNHA